LRSQARAAAAEEPTACIEAGIAKRADVVANNRIEQR
jgi:hypothetical protein